MTRRSHSAARWLALLVLTVGAGSLRAADSMNGARLFLADGCYACHGTTGAGGGVAGPKLAPDTLPVEAFLAKLRHPSGRMPVYGATVLSDDEVADIVAYLSSLPPGIPASQIPLLNP